jgi:hypothetical protein
MMKQLPFVAMLSMRKPGDAGSLVAGFTTKTAEIAVEAGRVARPAAVMRASERTEPEARLPPACKFLRSTARTALSTLRLARSAASSLLELPSPKPAEKISLELSNYRSRNFPKKSRSSSCPEHRFRFIFAQCSRLLPPLDPSYGNPVSGFRWPGSELLRIADRAEIDRRQAWSHRASPRPTSFTTKRAVSPFERRSAVSCRLSSWRHS